MKVIFIHFKDNTQLELWIDSKFVPSKGDRVSLVPDQISHDVGWYKVIGINWDRNNEVICIVAYDSKK